MLNSTYNMNWIDYITEIILKRTPTLGTSAVGTMHYIQIMAWFLWSRDVTQLLWRHNQNGVTKFTLKREYKFDK